MINPVIALREGVVFPHTEPILTFGRPKSNAGIEAALRGDKKIVFLAQKNSNTNPVREDLYEIGTLCTVEQVSPMGNELLVMVKALSRVKVSELITNEPYMSGTIEELPETYLENDHSVAMARQILSEFKQLFNSGKTVDFPVFMRLMSGVSASELTDQLANILDVKTADKQQLLETLDVEKRLEKILSFLNHEIKIYELEKDIVNQAQAKFDKSAKEQVLRERQRTISKELEKLGSETEGDDDFVILRKRIKKAKMPDEIRKKAEKELSRLSQMSFANPEANYIRTYLEWLCDMPWSIKSKNNIALSSAIKVLNEDHFGLDKVKERIMEYLSVLKLRRDKKDSKKEERGGTILCFAGPPGVGKTSLGKSIARALGRKFVRVSLGGIRDEAEIRGHRRTYVGALPGRIIQGIKTAGTKNPVFMLDEIDKLASDYRGDPSSALLEALDPEQNSEFSDHYLEVPFDLSQVMFITTANNLDSIPPALKDRLEIIQFSGYTSAEKVRIAKDYLWPKNLKLAGLSKNLPIEDKALLEIATRYTREAGVRELERSLAKICRKIARVIAENKNKKIGKQIIDITAVHKYLGPRKYPETLAEKKDEVGMSTGLAWTQVGGDILFIEVAHMPGKGDLQLTGQLGDVMKESAKAAFSYIRSRWSKLKLAKDFYKNMDIHVHVPEGAVPKDGPSAGIAMATAIISSLTDKPVRRGLAMTGEITLRGRVLEIGGVKEKVIAAHRAGITDVILPKDNGKDLIEVPVVVKKQLRFHFVSHLDDVLKLALKV